MKRVLLLAFLLSVCGAFALLKFTNNGLLAFSPEGGEYSAYRSGVERTYATPPLLPPSADAERWDYQGDAESALQSLNARVLRTETVCGITIIYAHTPRLPKTITLTCGKVNLMAAVQGKNVALGYPYLDGSY